MGDVYETTARVILTSGPLVLCAGAWDEDFCVLPGGHVEPGEHALQTVRRELYEECDLSLASVVKLTVLPNLWTRGTDLVHETMHLYAAATRGVLGGPLPRSPEARTALRWASVDDLLQGRVHLQPPALLPWVVRVAGRQ